jgi:hypothetical protein
MPRKINAELRACALRMAQERQHDYPSQTAVAQAVAKQLGLGRETVRRWIVQADIYAGELPGVTSAEQAEIKRLKTEKTSISPCGNDFLRGRARLPQSLIMGFIDDMRAQGHAVESTCRCCVRRAARSPAAGTVSDAVITDAILATAGTPEELYGRRKITHHLRRAGYKVAFCTVDRVMRDLVRTGIRGGKGVALPFQARSPTDPVTSSTAGFTGRWTCSHPPSSSTTISLPPSHRRSSRHESSTKAATVQCDGLRRRQL